MCDRRSRDRKKARWRQASEAELKPFATAIGKESLRKDFAVSY
jgi:hypothetical protein